MKERYESAEMEVVVLRAEDSITASDDETSLDG